MTSNIVSISAYLADMVDTVIAGYSYILQKQGLIQNLQKNMAGEKEPIICNKRWLCGFLLLLASSAAHLLFLPFAELTLLMTNRVVGVLVSYVFSILILKEKPVLKYDVPAVLFLVTGCLTIVFLSSQEAISYPKDRVIQLLTMNHFFAGQRQSLCGLFPQGILQFRLIALPHRDTRIKLQRSLQRDCQ